MRFVILFVFSLVMTNLQAQSFSIGGGLIYGDDIEEPGINLRAYYNLPGNRICFGPEFSTFLTHKETLNGEKMESDLYELNFNAHFIFELTHKFGIYPFTGLNFSHEKEKIITDVSRETVTEDKFGLNLGFGAHYALKDIVIFGEYDHLISDLSQNSITLGLFYTFGNKKIASNEEHDH